MDYKIINTKKDSSNVSKFVYDKDNHILTIQYYKKEVFSTYLHLKVPEDIALGLYKCAENKQSIGTYIHKHIRGKYNCEKIDCKIFDETTNIVKKDVPNIIKKDAPKLEDNKNIIEAQRKQIQLLRRQLKTKDEEIKELKEKNAELRKGFFNIEWCSELQKLRKADLLDKVLEYRTKLKEYEYVERNRKPSELEVDIKLLSTLALRFRNIIKYNHPLINIHMCDNDSLYLTSMNQEKEAKKTLKDLGLKTPVLTTWSIIRNCNNFKNRRLIISPDFMCEFADELNEIVAGTEGIELSVDINSGESKIEEIKYSKDTKDIEDNKNNKNVLQKIKDGVIMFLNKIIK